MRLPYLPYSGGKVRSENVTFGGVNYSENFTEGQWQETENVSCAEYPSLIPRAGRVAEANEENTSTLYVFDGVAKIIGTGFYWNDAYIAEVSLGRKQIVRVGDIITIYPDKARYYISENRFTNGQSYVTIPSLTGGQGSLTIASNTITAPTNGYTYTRVGNGTPLSGRGNIATLNTQIYIRENTAYVDQYNITPVYFDDSRVRTNRIIYYNAPNDTESWATITQVDKEYRNFWPDMTRQYITVHYKVNNTDRTISGWAYAEPNTYDANIPKINGQYYDALMIGSTIRNDSTNHTYDIVENIQKTLYTDHYYYTEIKTGHYEGEQYSGNFNLASALNNASITVGSKVILSRGTISLTCNVGSISNQTVSFYGSNGYFSLYNLNFATGAITIKKVEESTTNFDFIYSSGGRLWGVYQNKIYASKKGDITDFNPSDDLTVWRQSHSGEEPTAEIINEIEQNAAWEGEVTSSGEWTGIIEYDGNLLCFKEDMLHIVMGSNAQNFIVYDYNITGVKKGCDKSLSIVNGVLYYYGIEGVYAYSGNVPVLISQNFGLREYSDAVGGSDGLRYYISAKHNDDYDLHVYDVHKGIWMREDNLHVLDFAFYNSKLYALDSNGRFLKIGDGERRGLNEDDTALSWHIKSTPFYENSFNRKYHSKLIVRIELSAGASFDLYVSYDGGIDDKIYSSPPSSGSRVLIIPILPKRCDYFNVRIDGIGKFTLRGIAREYIEGSEY